MTVWSSTSKPLERLLAEIRSCRVCVEAPLGRPLAHEPRPVLCLSATARLLIAAQAPGVRVQRSGTPFTDASGDRLRSWLGLTPEVFYDARHVAIVAMGFCFPGHDAKGSDLPPRPECRALWHDRLFAAMPQIETILMIGRYAQDYHLRRLGRAGDAGRNLSETVSRWREIASPSRPRLFPLPHPSWHNNLWIKKNSWFEAELLPAVRHEVSRLLELEGAAPP
ncbi:MAG: uracil-DNA glycosylase family protein [Methylobacteriaceae bacterium]|nr:uracil-DNA glycosylase family protein [Methylobacteriaceae bacterium]